MVHIGNDWDEILADEFEKDYYLKIREILKKEYSTRTIYPDMHDIFNALKYTSYENTNVVILGQDPYHGQGQAHGLSFSVQDGVKLPPSLLNIYKEIETDIGTKMNFGNGNLTYLAKQGVLLLNASLTVRASEAMSHSKIGWSKLTDAIVRKINEKNSPVVYILWGNFAKEKAEYIYNPKHLVITGVHPSPLSASRGFFGSKPFSKTNNFLVQHGLDAINWSNIK
ncbi:uracil-DNA glycosylase [Criibacterium bergeronii]|uniref:Uracil-DNA glycosylase n=1 Tax=Criibacterium bergeronii TaxID=1871336 RepID=A0A371INP6_9FIRM|nr:uracil-DNA glycosylase [Criibacterium bergeronii]MBS6062484.1 uracil-DNA glycosylase [Peptostreptococcaceae bacterium]RDY22117.1 uracil-DNA glycosylase [Criibacterium bergeronii]TRW27775.1 uracil-DNA glycosylase [Criibacterium bergeronii]